MEKVSVTAISDLHGFLPDYSNYKSDIFCICGDVSPLKIQNNVPQMKNWLYKTFIPWTESLPCDKVFLIAGNHDLFAERLVNIKEFFLGTKVWYSEDDTYEYNDKLIHGTPWCKIFGNWSFMLTSDELEKKYAEIPENVDLLLTHDVPYGQNDVILEKVWWNTGEHIGNVSLLEAIQEKKPKNLCCGHLHSTDHTPTKFGDMMQYNCSIVDERYKIAYEPQTFII